MTDILDDIAWVSSDNDSSYTCGFPSHYQNNLIASLDRNGYKRSGNTKIIMTKGDIKFILRPDEGISIYFKNKFGWQAYTLAIKQYFEHPYSSALIESAEQVFENFKKGDYSQYEYTITDPKIQEGRIFFRTLPKEIINKGKHFLYFGKTYKIQTLYDNVDHLDNNEITLGWKIEIQTGHKRSGQFFLDISGHLYRIKNNAIFTSYDLQMDVQYFVMDLLKELVNSDRYL